jgi:hypothetical protein
MPVPSNYPNFEIPEVDLWEFLLEREDRKFPDEKSMPRLLTGWMLSYDL